MIAMQMYLPYTISLEEFYNTLSDELLFGKEVQLDIVLKEMLENIMHDKVGNYGRYQGILGSYLVQTPRLLTHEETIADDIVLHEFELMLTDILAGYFPEMSMMPHGYRFFNPPGTHHLLIYAPVTRDLSPDESRKAVPEAALHYTLR